MVFLFLCVYLHLYDTTFSHMDHVQKQRESIVLYKEKRNSADYIRIKYVTSQAIAMLLTQDTDVEKAGDNSAYILREYHPKKWLFEGETPGEPYSASALSLIHI